MKKQLYYMLTALALLSFVFVGCKDDGPNDPVITLDLSTHELEFAYDEMNVDTVVVATTNAETISVDVTYADATRTGWVDAEADGKNVHVMVTSRNEDPEERPRMATVKVMAGDKTDTIAVTQLAYIETDFSISMAAGELAFAAGGNELTKTMEATTKVALTGVATVDETGAPAEVEWITALTFEGKTVTVTVAENTSLENTREAIVKVTNRGEQSATFTVTQELKQPFDLSGEWTWTSLNPVQPNAEGWAAATDTTATATISAVAGGYEVRGIKGRGELLGNYLNGAPNADFRMTIRQDGDNFFSGIYDDQINVGDRFGAVYITVDQMFSPGSAQFYLSGVSVSATGGEYTLDNNIGITRSIETIEGVEYEVLTYATTHPDSGNTLSYIYYAFNRGRWEYLDFHRNLVLKRPVQN